MKGSTTATNVTIGVISPGSMDSRFVHSLLELLSYDASGSRHVADWMLMESGPLIWMARNKIIETWLESRGTEWLLFLDVDMVFRPDAVDRLFDVADPERRALISGLCPVGGRGADFCSNVFYADPPIVGDGPIELDFTRQYTALLLSDALNATNGGAVRVDATGAAFLLVHRNVATAVAERYATRDDGLGDAGWFAPDVSSGQTFGEDLIFCMRAASCGYRPWVHGGVHVSHRKAFTVNVFGEIES